MSVLLGYLQFVMETMWGRQFLGFYKGFCQGILDLDRYNRYSSFSGPVKKSNRDWTVVDSPGNYWKRQRGTPGLSPAIPIPCNWVENRDNDQNNRKMSVRDLDGRMVSVPGPRVLCSDNIAGRSRVWSKNNTRNLDGPVMSI